MNDKAVNKGKQALEIQHFALFLPNICLANTVHLYVKRKSQMLSAVNCFGTLQSHLIGLGVLVSHKFFLTSPKVAMITKVLLIMSWSATVPGCNSDIPKMGLEFDCSIVFQGQKRKHAEGPDCSR